MEKETEIYWSKINDGEWDLVLAATEKGLCFIDKCSKTSQETELITDWLKRRFKKISLVRDDSKFTEVKKQLEQYFSGNSQPFNLKFDYEGTDFQEEVWEALLKIPYGETWNYSEIANKINRPKAVRAVGAAVGNNPLLIVIPCHRVIGKDGSLTGFRSGLDTKINLLNLEATNKNLPKGS